MARQLIRFVVAAGLILASRPDSASAQSNPAYPVVAGSKIRVEAPTFLAGQFEGTVKEIDDQSLLIEIANRPAIRVQREAITQLDVSLGRRRHFLKGAKIGAGIGAVLAVLAAGEMRLGEPLAVAATSGVLVGGMYGAAIGALVKTDRWAAVPRTPVPVSSTAAQGRRVLTLASVSF